MKNKNTLLRLVSHLPEKGYSGSHFEHIVGHAVLVGEITAEEGYQQLELFEANQGDFDGNEPETPEAA